MTQHLGDPSHVRLADARDQDELFEMTRLLHGEIGIFPIAEHKVRQMIREAVTGPPERRGGLIGAIGSPGNIMGSICLQIGSYWYTDSLVFSERWNFVLPPYRHTSASQDLIAFARTMSDQFDIPLMISVVSNDRTAAKVRLYRKQLGEPVGAFFAHNAKRVGDAHV